VHTAFKPLDGRFRDFIAIPKANGYQSLHTVLFGPYGSPIEVQIRTERMDLIAERGIAAHWSYKHGGDAPTARRAARTSGSPTSSNRSAPPGSSLEFLENVKVDLFPDEVYLFTPKGAILSLPRNATVLGLRLRGAHRRGQQGRRRARRPHAGAAAHEAGERADGGDHHREVVRRRSRSGWSSSVSGKARTAIRHQLKHLEHEDAVQLGHRMLDRALEGSAPRSTGCRSKHLDAYPFRTRYPRLERLLADIALGNRMPSQVSQVLARARPTIAPTGMEELIDPSGLRGPSDKILITGSERARHHLRQLLPADSGRRDHGLPHRRPRHRGASHGMPQRRRAAQVARTLGAVDWDREVTGDYQAALKIEVDNRPGVLAQVAAAIAQAESNIDRVEYVERDSNVSAIRFSIEVHDRKHLADVIRRVRRLGVGARRAASLSPPPGRRA
jgi:guanosine-3',5'-bis(diphosphate) 3'-pyrophosphohydrolase